MNYYNSIDINLYNKQVSIIITRFKNRLLEDIEFNALFSNKNYEKEVNDLALNIKNIITIVEEKTNYNITYLSDELDKLLSNSLLSMKEYNASINKYKTKKTAHKANQERVFQIPNTASPPTYTKISGNEMTNNTK